MSDITIDRVAHVLEIAAHQHQLPPEQIELARRQIQQWESAQAGYFATIQLIGQNKDAALNSRILALTQLRNGVEHHWRSASQGINAEEQQTIRSQLLQIDLDESDNRVVNQIAGIFANIARKDFPRFWPSLFDDLILWYRSVQQSSPDEKANHRRLYILRIIQKTISGFQTLRLAQARKQYREKAEPLFDILANDGCDLLVYILYSPENFRKSSPLDLSQTLAIMKCVRRLAVGALEEPEKNANFLRLWQLSQTYLEFGLSSSSQDNIILIYKLVEQVVKLHITIAQDHPITFGSLRPKDLVHSYWIKSKTIRDQPPPRLSRDDEDDSQEHMTEFFCLKALVLLRECFKIAYNTGSTMKIPASGDREKMTNIREHMKLQILTGSFTLDIFKGIISSYLILSDKDIDEWMDDPEEWAIREESFGDAFEQDIRPCATRLLLDTTINDNGESFRLLSSLMEEYCPESQESLKQQNGQSSQYNSTQQLLIKDSLYTALGTAASRFYKDFNIFDFLHRRIPSDMEFHGELAKILRRRIAILLSQWTPLLSDCTTDSSQLLASKEFVYQIYDQLLESSDQRNDLLVRITAGRRLKAVVDEFGFQREAFRAHTNIILGNLEALLSEAQLPENKADILQTLQCLIERMGEEIVPFADQIVRAVEYLWKVFEGEEHMKKSILGVLKELARGLQESSKPLQGPVAPLLRQVLDPKSKGHLNLFEDSIDLLHALLEQSTEPGNEQFIHVAAAHMEQMDQVEDAVIVKLLTALPCLLLLAPNDIVGSSGACNRLITLLTPLISHRSREIHQEATSNMEIILILASTGISQIVDMGHAFTKFSLEYVLDSQKGVELPDRPHHQLRTETSILLIWARLIQASPEAFFRMVQLSAEEHHADAEVILSRILSEWFRHLDHVAEMKPKKAMVLALTYLLELRPELIQGRLQEYMAMWTSMILEIRPDEEDDKYGDLLVMSGIHGLSGGQSPHEKRLDKLSAVDPAYTVNIIDFIRKRVDALVQWAGGVESFTKTWLESVDQDVVDQFRAVS